MAVFYDKDANPALIRKRRITILGLGTQGRAHALNLRDSGVDVQVGLRDGSASFAVCEALGLDARPLADAVKDSDFVMMLIPDEQQARVYREILSDALKPGAVLAFAHGFNIHYGLIEPRDDLDVVMVAPLGIGDQVRATYERGGGVPALLCVHQDASGTAGDIALAYACANGHGRAGVIESSFRDETETDLFAEQAVLCGGLTHLIVAAYETLVDAGYPEELAYFSCLHEVKLIADLVHTRGIAGMRESISTTAEYGDYTRGPRIINETTRAQMTEMLNEIQNGQFAKELVAEIKAGAITLKQGRKKAKHHGIEKIGAHLRLRMPWLSSTDDGHGGKD